MKRLGVLGAGSWGTALAVHYAEAGASVLLGARDPEAATELEAAGRNERYLPQAQFPDRLAVSGDLGGFDDIETIVVAVPSHAFRSVVRRLLRRHPPGPLTLVSAAKGVETETLARMSQVVFEEAVATDREVGFATLSGPTFAAELVTGQPSAAVIASEDVALSSRLRGALSTVSFRLYSSSDVAGVETGGAAKNVIAIAAGIVSGSGLGHNTLAALITRGLHEITRLGVATGGQARTFSGLAGLGDLVLTCTGDLSRNRRTGMLLAEGLALEEVSDRINMVAEGVKNALSITRLAQRLGVEMPITEQVEAVIYQDKDLELAVDELMSRELKPEAEL